MSKNTILFYNTDSDGWMKNQFAVKGRIGDTFKQTYEEIKEQLEEPEILDFVKDMMCVDKMFLDKHGNQLPYKFMGTHFDIEGLTYIFAPLSNDDIDYEEDQKFAHFNEREHITTF